MFPRLEMHAKGRSDLYATHGSTFVYAWWFFLSSSIVADTSYWHIFQVWAVLAPSVETICRSEELMVTTIWYFQFFL